MTDEMIMEAVKKGDLQQVTPLFQRHYKRIFNFLARMTGDRALAEDLTQNVFLRLIKYRSSYKEGLRFQSWMYQMARNVFSDHYQASKKKPAGSIAIEKVQENLDDGDGSHQLLEQEEILRKSLAMLPEDQRELLVLARFQHMKYEEVAVIMNTSVANVKVKVHRAIAKLREYYFQLESQ